jgi:hypothetical protein
VVLRWLGQLRVAPYSYDLLDNRGRRSPRELTAGLDELAVGQRFMTIFTLAAFEPGKHITVRIVPGSPRNLFGDLAVSYKLTAPVRSLTCPPGRAWRALRLARSVGLSAVCIQYLTNLPCERVGGDGLL